MRTTVARLVAVLAVAAAAASAWAQDYTVTESARGSLIETRPANATRLANLTSSGLPNQSSGVSFPLPFSFPYFGGSYASWYVGPMGYLMPRTATNFSYEKTKPGHGEDPTTGAFPFTPTGLTLPGREKADGVIAPYWQIWQLNDGTPVAGQCYTWTSGLAPNRRFVASWEMCSIGGKSDRVTVQVQLHESSGRIVFAYGGPVAAYAGSSATCGIDSPIDSRFVVPSPYANSATNDIVPQSDYTFDPRPVTITGKLLFEQDVSDASGIGNSTLGNQPIAQCDVRLRRTSDGHVYATGRTAADGTFSVTGLALPAQPAGELVVLAQNAACAVSQVGLIQLGTPTEWIAAPSVSFASDASVGTLTLTAANDVFGDRRGPLHMARICGALHAWAVSRTTDTIPLVNILYAGGSLEATTYLFQKRIDEPSLPCFSRIASSRLPNPDMWDDAVVTALYGRHLLASISAPPGTSYDNRFDAITGDSNAFAQGFGHWLWARVSESSAVVDGTSTSTAMVHDLETPAITAREGPDVAGCIAGALYDLLDPANEPFDPIDGTLDPDRVFRLADSMTSAPTVATLLEAWMLEGHDPAEFTRAFIASGAFADDAFEPNDTGEEAAPLGVPGDLHESLAIRPFNEDWFSVTLPADTTALSADAGFPTYGVPPSVGVEIWDANARLVTGVHIPGREGVYAKTGPVPAGTYRVRVMLESGGAVPAYALQTYFALTMDVLPLHDWTVGRPYDLPVGAAGGIAPYALNATRGSLPDGIELSTATLRASGVPTVPGVYTLTVELRDSGDPVSAVARDVRVVIHDVFEFAVPAFVGFPAGKFVDTTLPTHEGTPPFTFTVPTGTLPAGLVVTPGTSRLTGTAEPQASSVFELDGVDVAGSRDHVATRAVVAAALSGRNVAADLAAGEDACGWWFDAAAGSTVSFSAKTAKGRAKRVLTGTVLGPDRQVVAGAVVKAKFGSLSVTRLNCPMSGRYYVIASGDEYGSATQLVGNASVALPRAGGGTLAGFSIADTTAIEIGVAPGATVRLKFNGDKQTGLMARVIGLVDPTGATTSFVDFVKKSGLGGTLTAKLPTGGTWTVILGATGGSAAGNVTWSYKIAQPNGVAYSAD